MIYFLNFRFKRYAYFAATLTFLTAGHASYSIWFQQAFHFPKPTGQYGVGIKEYHWVDSKRKEILGDDTAHPHRELMVNIWYPSKKQSHQKAKRPYAPYIVDYFKKTDPLVYHLVVARGIYSYAQPDIPIANDETKFPIILFSHGFVMGRDANTIHCEELASHGYIVVGISHTYDSCIVQFPDGRLIKGNSDERFSNLEGEAEIEKEWSKSNDIWVADVQFVLNKLEQLNNNKQSLFYQKFDQQNIGMFGHSFGGSTAIQLCRLDSRIKAGVDLDGPLHGSNPTKRFDTPCMFILSGNIVQKQLEEENPPKGGLFAMKKLCKAIGDNAYLFSLKDAGHMAFCDYALAKNVSFIARIFMKLGIVGDLGIGSIDGFRATEIVNAYLVNFFDKYLKGQPSELLDGESEAYPEVKSKWWEFDTPIRKEISGC